MSVIEAAATSSFPARVPGADPLYLLGCRERRVTIYSQQVRAIELAHHLLTTKAVRPDGHLAIVGAGIGGVTLAAMLAVAAPKLRIVLFDSEGQLLHLQAGARDRFVHPHLFDWPLAKTREEAAGLPVLDWQAGMADAVAIHLREQFEALRHHGNIELRLTSRVDGLRSRGPDLNVSVNGSFLQQEFDAVALCIGFGYEKQISPLNPSYWSPSALPAPLLKHGADDSVFISGNGDGGLADFALAAFDGFSHQSLLNRVLEHPGTRALEPTLNNLEDQAWSDSTFDLYQAYQTHLPPLTSANLLRDVRDWLRRKGKVILHTQSTQLLRADTALLNRLVAFLAIYADREYKRDAITTITNVKIVPAATGTPGAIALADGRTFEPRFTFFRFGPDRVAVQDPFADAFSRHGSEYPDRNCPRPTTPELNPSVRQWADSAVQAAIGPRPGSIAMAGSPLAEGRQSTGTAPSATQINVVTGDVGAGATLTQIYTGR